MLVHISTAAQKRDFAGSASQGTRLGDPSSRSGFEGGDESSSLTSEIEPCSGR